MAQSETDEVLFCSLFTIAPPLHPFGRVAEAWLNKTEPDMKIIASTKAAVINLIR
jgi:hypothetical protein